MQPFFGGPPGPPPPPFQQFGPGPGMPPQGSPFPFGHPPGPVPPPPFMQQGPGGVPPPLGHGFGPGPSLEDVPLPGTALVEELDQRLMVQLRDGRKVIGTLRSFDQFANLVIEKAVERIIVGEQYGDIPLGLQLIRGENVVLLGRIDPDREVPPNLTKVSEAEIKQALKGERELNKLKAQMRSRFDFLDLE